MEPDLAQERIAQMQAEYLELRPTVRAAIANPAMAPPDAYLHMGRLGSLSAQLQGLGALPLEERSERVMAEAIQAGREAYRAALAPQSQAATADQEHAEALGEMVRLERQESERGLVSIDQIESRKEAEAQQEAAREAPAHTPEAMLEDILQHAGYAQESLDAFLSGKTIPQVALSTQYEPGQAEVFLRSIVREYGVDRAREVLREDTLSLLEREPHGLVDRESSRRAQKTVEEIASELKEYASQQAPLPYVNAEAAIAESFRQQLASGSRNINLSQRYATEDQALAQERHERALENLMPLIRETAGLEGYSVQRGAAIAEGLVQREVPAISQRQGQSIGS